MRALTDDAAITLRHAAEEYGFSLSTLKAEAGRGRLTIYRIGNKNYTTPADIREMVNQCRVERNPRAFTLTKPEGNGSSATDRASSARAAANETALMLRNSSRNTSAGSISRNRQVRR